MAPRRAVAAALPAALSGAAFVGLEAAAAWGAPVVVDAPPPATEVLAAMVGLALLLGAAALLVARWWPRRASAAAVVAWALVWAPEGPRSAGAPLAWSAAPVGLLVAVAIPAPHLAVALGALGGGWVPAWRPRVTGDAPPRGPAAGPDLLLVTVDTTRADAGLTDGLGSGWQRWPQAVSAAPWTLPAMHSLWTGQPVDAHRGGLPAAGGWTPRAPDHPSLAHALRERSYETVAFASNPHLGAAQGFADGFDRWTHAGRDREPLLLLHNLDGQRARWTGRAERRRRGRDARLVAAARAELARPSDRPRLVWLHLMRPHEYRRDAAHPPPGWAPGTEDGEALRGAYAGNVAATRALLAPLLAAAARWTVAITSDHGEALGEAGRWGHGHRLWDPELRVPLAVRVPAQPGGVVEHPVAVLDLLPALIAHADGAPAVTLPARPQVAVAGLRDAPAAGTWTAQGVVLGPPLVPGRAARLPSDTEAALEALGYTAP